MEGDDEEDDDYKDDEFEELSHVSDTNMNYQGTLSTSGLPPLAKIIRPIGTSGDDQR